MTTRLKSPFRRGLLALSCCLLAFATMAAHAKELKFQAQLVWATNTNTEKSVDHKLVDAPVRQKLEELPLKWKNYFLIHNVHFSVPQSGSKEAVLSKKCTIRIKDIDGKNFEISLIGKDKPVLKRTQSLPKGEMLVLGGNAPNSTAWLVVLKRIE
ncbi:MAG TPA: hypothetical protein VFM25_09935 [Verrucomicrobiae bacterium]|nr:hypothetical protein [Verrucomicrobiae bacterium]